MNVEVTLIEETSLVFFKKSLKDIEERVSRIVADLQAGEEVRVILNYTISGGP